MAQITVIMTSYNRPVAIRKSIESVLNQTYNDLELVIVDGSTNNAAVDVIKEYLTYKNVSLILLPNTNCSAKINHALKTIETPFVTYITDDDTYYPQRLERLISEIDCGNGKHIVYGNQSRVFYNQDGSIREYHIARANGVLSKASCVVDHNSVLHCTHCAKDVGFWDEREEVQFQADAYYWDKLTDNGYLFYPVNVLGEQKNYHYYGLNYKFLRGENPTEGPTDFEQ